MDTTGGGFLVEDFIQSITTQLDRVQDSLRIKAVNRPLTYALKELHLELKVFVDLDPTGNVRLRASSGNETGASLISMDFTTITKPMIEENTVSLASSRSPPLNLLGLSNEEAARLERLGVTNLAQLDKLKGSTSVTAVSRLSDVPIDRLRRALQVGPPVVRSITATPPPPVRPAPPPPQPPMVPRPPVASTPPVRMPNQPPGRPPIRTPARPTAPIIARPPPLNPQQRPQGPQRHQVMAAAPAEAQTFETRPALAVAAGCRSLTLEGAQLLSDENLPEVRLNGESLAIEDADHDRLVVRLPTGFAEGELSLSFDGGETLCFALVHQTAPDTDTDVDIDIDIDTDADPDPWAPPPEREPA